MSWKNQHQSAHKVTPGAHEATLGAHEWTLGAHQAAPILVSEEMAEDGPLGMDGQSKFFSVKVFRTAVQAISGSKLR